MSLPETKKDIVSKLQKSILSMQGFTPVSGSEAESVGLGPIESAFPNGIFPSGAIHEFLISQPEQAAASGGFIAGILNSLMRGGGVCLWISGSRSLFPSALKMFGVEPDRIIFVDLKRDRDVLWVTEEALKCQGLAAVVAELREINFTQSRRLQLAVEQSRVSGFILRTVPRKLSSTACFARWNVSSLPSELPDGLPGVGFPRWHVELLKVRNGNPGSWKMEWAQGRFEQVAERSEVSFIPETLKVG
jgi:protein ImuA